MSDTTASATDDSPMLESYESVDHVALTVLDSADADLPLIEAWEVVAGNQLSGKRIVAPKRTITKAELAGMPIQRRWALQASHCRLR